MTTTAKPAEVAAAGAATATPPAFDPEAFKTSILAEFNKGINAIDKKITAIGKAAKAEGAGTGGNGSGTGEGAAGGAGDGSGAGTGDGTGTGDIKIADPALNAAFQRMMKQVQTLTKKVGDTERERDTERVQRLETERRGTVQSILNEIPFRDEPSRQLFFRSVIGDIKRDEAGTLIADADTGPLPAKDFIKTQVDLFPHLLAPKGTGGAGASGGRAVGGGNKWTMADLTPAKINAMDKPTQTELLAAIAAGQVT